MFIRTLQKLANLTANMNALSLSNTHNSSSVSATSTPTTGPVDNNKVIQDDENRLELVTIMTKYTILVVTQLLSTFLFMLLFGLLVYGYIMDMKWLSIFYWIYAPIEVIINISSILLQFVFNNYFYYKICGICQNKLKNYLMDQN